MKKNFSRFLTFVSICTATLSAFIFASCSDLFTSRNGSISICLPASREAVSGEELEPASDDYYYDFEVCNSIGTPVFTEEKTQQTQITVSDLEPGKYSVVVKAYTREIGPAGGTYNYIIKYANFSREKYVNVKGATAYNAVLHSVPNITVIHEGESEELLNINLNNFYISDSNKSMNYNYSQWKDNYTIAYDKTKTGQVTFTVTSNDFDFISANCVVTVTDSSESSPETVTSWEDLKAKVEEYTDTTTQKTFYLGGSYTASSTITVSGNVSIVPTTITILDRDTTAGSQFTDGPLFEVSVGATLSLGGSDEYSLTLEGRCGEIAEDEAKTDFTAELTSSAALIHNYGNLYLNKKTWLKNNYNSSDLLGGAIFSQVKSYGDSVKIIMNDCSISNCYSKSGGAIWAKGLYDKTEKDFTKIEFVMTDGAISCNYAKNNGGGVYLSYVNGTIKNDAYITQNTAGASASNNAGQGGGIFLTGLNEAESTILTVKSDSFVTNNFSNMYGGGAYVANFATMTVESPSESFSGNTLGTSTSAKGKFIYIAVNGTYNGKQYTKTEIIDE